MTTTTETREFQLKIVVTQTVGPTEALKYYKDIYNPETDIDKDTEDTIAAIVNLSESLEKKKVSSNAMMKKMAAVIKTVPREKIEVFTAMMIEILTSQCEDDKTSDNLEYLNDIRARFFKQVAELPANNAGGKVTSVLPTAASIKAVMPESSIETPEITAPAVTVPTMQIIDASAYSFTHWLEYIPIDEQEQILQMSPAEAQNWFQMDPITALQRLSLPNNTYRQRECSWRTKPPGCLNGFLCTYSHHPLNRKWIDLHLTEYLEFLKQITSTARNDFVDNREEVQPAEKTN